MTQTLDVLRPAPGGLKGRVMAWLMPWVMETVLPLGFRLLRALPWNPRFGKVVVATRYDEVREVFLNDPSFRVPTRKISKSSWAGIRSLEHGHTEGVAATPLPCARSYGSPIFRLASSRRSSGWARKS